MTAVCAVWSDPAARPADVRVESMLRERTLTFSADAALSRRPTLLMSRERQEELRGSHSCSHPR